MSALSPRHAPALARPRPAQAKAKAEQNGCIDAILPFGHRKVWWDKLILVAVLYTAITVPFIAGLLTRGDVPLVLLVVQYVIDAVFLIDMHAAKGDRTPEFEQISAKDLPETNLTVRAPWSGCRPITAHTAFVSSAGNLVTDLAEVRLRYLHTYFAVDLLSTIPWDLPFFLDLGTPVQLWRSALVVRTPRLTQPGPRPRLALTSPSPRSDLAPTSPSPRADLGPISACRSSISPRIS